MSEPPLPAPDPAAAPDEWARETASRLASGGSHLDEKTLRDELLEIWRAAVVADRGLGDAPREAPLASRLVARPPSRDRRECPPSVTHLTSRDSTAVHVLPDPAVWATIPSRNPGEPPRPKTIAWAQAAAASMLGAAGAAESDRSYLAARLLGWARDAASSTSGHGALSLVDVTDPRLARLDIRLQPSAGSDEARHVLLDPPSTAPGIAEVDYYAHRDLGPANRVLHFCPPGTVDLGSAPTASLKLLWPLDDSSDLLVVLTTRCAERLLDVLPAVDRLVETLEVCRAPASVDGARQASEPKTESLLQLLDPQTQARYQVFAENFVRGLGRLPEALEVYRPLLEGATRATDAEIEQFRADLARPAGPLASTQILLLHVREPGSGEDRVYPLNYCTVGSSYGVFAYRSGSTELPEWYEEILVNQDVRVEIRDRVIEVRASVLDGARREAIWEEQKARYPGLAEYESRTRPVIPVVMLERR